MHGYMPYVGGVHLGRYARQHDSRCYFENVRHKPATELLQ